MQNITCRRTELSSCYAFLQALAACCPNIPYFDRTAQTSMWFDDLRDSSARRAHTSVYLLGTGIHAKGDALAAVLDSSMGCYIAACAVGADTDIGGPCTVTQRPHRATGTIDWTEATRPRRKTRNR